MPVPRPGPDDGSVQAAGSDELQARDTRLAVVAHDLRSPIANVVFASGLLQLRFEQAGVTGADDLIHNIIRTAQYMTRLVDDLTDTDNLEHGRFSLQLEAIRADELIHDAIAAHAAPAAQLRIRLIADPASATRLVHADPARILQVYSNLVGNALKFTDAGGEVRLSARADGDMVRFGVCDTGHGIHADELPHIFEPFWRRDTTTNRGLGLGLAIARAIVELHGGELSVRSSPGAGSAFYFTLPVPSTRSRRTA